MRRFLISTLLLGTVHIPAGAAPASAPTLAEVLAESTDEDWRRPALENTLYLDIPAGRVVIELAPQFAPKHVENIRTLARAHYWDGLAILRVQDNYVVQWGDPKAGTDTARALPEDASARLPAEFDTDSTPLPFTRLESRDAYAPEVGFVDGFAAARDPARGRTWLTHCYGLVGAGRDNPADSSNGTELYVVIGHAPRHLDRNITSVGRVLQGMELLSSLPRGPAPMGFFEEASRHVPIGSLRLASDVPENERTALDVFRTDTPAFGRLIQARRERHEPWFVDPIGAIELCNVPIPVRAAQPSHPHQPLVTAGQSE